MRKELGCRSEQQSANVLASFAARSTETLDLFNDCAYGFVLFVGFIRVRRGDEEHIF